MPQESHEREAREPHTPCGARASLPRSRSLFSASFQTARAYLRKKSLLFFLVHFTLFMKHWGESWVENTTRCEVFLTIFTVFHLAMKHCRMPDITSQTKWFWREKLRFPNWAVFYHISKHSQTFPLYFLYELLRVRDRKMKEWHERRQTYVCEC